MHIHMYTHIENIKWRLRFNYLVFVCPYMVIVAMSMLAYVRMRSSSLLISTKILLYRIENLSNPDV
jgi:hypothetical protein